MLRGILEILQESEKTFCKIEILFERENKNTLSNWNVAELSPKKFDYNKLSSLEEIVYKFELVKIY